MSQIEFREAVSVTVPGPCNSVSSCRKNTSFITDLVTKFLLTRHSNLILLLLVLYCGCSGQLSPDPKQNEEQYPLARLRMVLFAGFAIMFVTLAIVFVLGEFSEELPRRLRDRLVNNQKCKKLVKRF